MAKQYVVVEFVKEEAVGVVHSTWIVHDARNKVVYSYWPVAATNVTKKVQKGEQPDKERWSKVQVRILSYSDSFAEALMRSKRAEETSNLDSESEEECRRKSRPRTFSYSDSDDDIPRVVKKIRTSTPVAEAPVRLPRAPTPAAEARTPVAEAPVRLPRAPTPLSAAPIRLPRAPTPVSGAPIQRLRAPTPLSPRRLSWSAGSDREDVPSRRDLQPAEHSGLRQDLNKLAIQIARVQQNQKLILSLLRGISTSDLADGESIDDILREPCRSRAELESLDSKIKADPVLGKKLASYYGTFGGKDLPTSTRMLMRTTAINSVWSEYSVKGRKKRCLVELAIWRPLSNSLMALHKVSRKDVEDGVCEFLKHTPRQTGGALFKRRTLSEVDNQDNQEEES